MINYHKFVGKYNDYSATIRIFAGRFMKIEDSFSL